MTDGAADHDDDAPPPRRLRRFAPLAVVAAGAAAVWLLGWHDRLSMEALAESGAGLKGLVAAHPVLAPALFVLAYGLAVALSFPTPSLLAAASGFLFGWLAGAVYAVVAATAGGTVLFLAARSAFGGLLRRRAGPAARFAAGFERDAFGTLLVLRIAPFVPFVLVSILPALFAVRLRVFLAATLIGVLPGAFSYAWLGTGIDGALAAAERSGRAATPADLMTPELAFGLLALTAAAALAMLVRRVWARRGGGPI